MISKELQLKKAKTYDQNPKAALFFEIVDSLNVLKEIKSVFGKLDLSDLKHIKGEKGDKGDKGDNGKDGYIPIKETQAFILKNMPKVGIDFLTPDEIKSHLKKVTPIKGIHYRDGIDGKDGTSASEITALEIVNKLNTVQGLLKSHTIENLPSIEKMVAEVVKELKNPKGKYRLERKDILNMPENNPLDQRWHGSGGGGFSAGFQIPTGVVNGSNRTFVFVVAPSVIVVDGSPMRKLQADGVTANWMGTTSVVMTSAPNYDIYSLA